MACRLIGAKPLSEPMLPYYQLDSNEHISVKLYLKFKSGIHGNAFQNVVCEMVAILSQPQCVKQAAKASLPRSACEEHDTLHLFVVEKIVEGPYAAFLTVRVGTEVRVVTAENRKMIHCKYMLVLISLCHSSHVRLTHCGLVVPYGDTDVGQHLFSTKPLPEPMTMSTGHSYTHSVKI